MKKLLVMSAAAAVLFAASAPAAFADDPITKSGDVQVTAATGTLAFGSVPGLAVYGGQFTIGEDGNATLGAYTASYGTLNANEDGIITDSDAFTIENTDSTVTSVQVTASVTNATGLTLVTKTGATPLADATLDTVDTSALGTFTVTPAPLTPTVQTDTAKEGIEKGTITYTLTPVAANDDNV